MKSDSISTNNPDGKTRKKIVSARQLAANRANAQKSCGPKTQEGKDRAKFNNLKHGLTAMQVCIPNESHEAYELRRQAYYDLWKPENIAEEDAMDDYIAARWRKRRVIKYETALSIEARLRLQHEHELTYDTLSIDVEVALAFKHLCDNSNAIKLLDRYESRITRDLRASWQQFQQLVLSRPVQPDMPVAPPAEAGELGLPNEAIEEQPVIDATTSEPPQPAAEPQSQPEPADGERSQPAASNQPLATDQSQPEAVENKAPFMAVRFRRVAEHSPLVTRDSSLAEDSPLATLRAGAA